MGLTSIFFFIMNWGLADVLYLESFLGLGIKWPVTILLFGLLLFVYLYLDDYI